jgi:hypothetical protein
MLVISNLVKLMLGLFFIGDALRTFPVEVLSEFHLHLINRYISVATSLKNRRNEFHGDENLLTRLLTQDES